MKYGDVNGRIFISGTGRAGTTFLVQLLTLCDHDTGYTVEMVVDPGKYFKGKEQRVYFETARAGFERDPFDPLNPRIVKCPSLCDHLDNVVRAGIEVAGIIIPVRDVISAAESRRVVEKSYSTDEGSIDRPGGLFGTSKHEEQEAVLALKFIKLVESAVRNQISIEFLSFPRLALEASYTYEKLRAILETVSWEKCQECFYKCSRPELINSFRLEAR